MLGTRARRAAPADGASRAAATIPRKRSQAATGQTPVQLPARPGQAAAHGPQRTAKLRGSLLLRQTLPVAERHDRAVFLREPPNLFLNDQAEFGTILLAPIGRTAHLHDS